DRGRALSCLPPDLATGHYRPLATGYCLRLCNIQHRHLSSTTQAADPFGDDRIPCVRIRLAKSLVDVGHAAQVIANVTAQLRIGHTHGRERLRKRVWRAEPLPDGVDPLLDL